MRFPQVSIASLFGFIALIAVDCAWYRANYINGQSVFQFGDAPAFDTGVVPIANVAAIGLYMIVVTKGRARPWLIGFVLGAIASLVAFLFLGWGWPDGVRLWLRPIYMVWRCWSSDLMPKSYLYLADTACFLSVQLLIATIAGFMASCIWRGRRCLASAGESEIDST